MRTIDLIELHDSMAELRREGSSVVIDLKPVPIAPLQVSAGSIQVAGSQLDLMPAPTDEAGAVVALLEFVDGSSVSIEGTGVVIELLGAARDIEALPPEWAPAVDAV